MERFIAAAPSSVYGEKSTGNLIAGVWELDLLLTGNIAIFTDTGAIKAATGAISASGSKWITIARSFGSTAMPMLVNKIDVASLKTVKTVYAGPAEKRIALGQDNNSSVTSGLSLNLPSLIANGETYGCLVIDESKPHENTQRNRVYELSVVDSDVITGTGANNIITKLVAKINADTKAVVTAAATTGGTANNVGIVYTGKTAGVPLQVRPMSGLLERATVSTHKIKAGVYDGSYTTFVTYSSGRGTYTELLKTESDYNSHIGYAGQNFQGTPLATNPTQLVAGAIYTQYTLHYVLPIDDANLIRNPNFTNKCIIAVPALDSVQIGILDTLFGV